MGQLNELQVKAAQPRGKEYMLSDGEGLYLRVRPNGKVWIYRYKQSGKQAKLSFGPYPAVPLIMARRKARDEAEKRAGGIDPRDARREQAERNRAARLNSFELMARAWHAQAQKDREWSASYTEKVMRHLELHIFPWLGSLSMDAIKPTELVRCLHRIKERGNLETAQRVREVVQHVFQYAVDVGALEPAKNFVNSRTGGLPAPRARHYPAITDPEKLGQLLRDIRGYSGHVSSLGPGNPRHKVHGAHQNIVQAASDVPQQAGQKSKKRIRIFPCHQRVAGVRKSRVQQTPVF